MTDDFRKGWISACQSIFRMQLGIIGNPFDGDQATQMIKQALLAGVPMQLASRPGCAQLSHEDEGIVRVSSEILETILERYAQQTRETLTQSPEYQRAFTAAWFASLAMISRQIHLLAARPEWQHPFATIAFALSASMAEKLMGCPGELPKTFTEEFQHMSRRLAAEAVAFVQKTGGDENLRSILKDFYQNTRHQEN